MLENSGNRRNPGGQGVAGSNPAGPTKKARRPAAYAALERRAFPHPGAVRGDVLRTSAPGHAIRTRSRFPHARVPSSLGRDVPGGWHGRPERPATHPLIDHPDRALEAGIFARAYTAISASGSPGNASSTIPHAVPAIVR